MREVPGFIAWLWRSMEGWQKMFLFSMFLQGVGWTWGGEWGPWIGVTGAVIILCYLFKWAVWDSVSKSWARYREERNKLFTTIRDSDS
jgi:hypothetical protein